MRSFTAILLLVVVLLQTGSKWLIVAGYALNKSYIAAKLCQNKAKPMLHCNGKCHLRKQMQQEDGGNDKGPQHVKEKFEEAVANEAGNEWQLPVCLLPARLYKPLETYARSGYTAPVFHPPGSIMAV